MIKQLTMQMVKVRTTVVWHLTTALLVSFESTVLALHSLPHKTPEEVTTKTAPGGREWELCGD